MFDKRLNKFKFIQLSLICFLIFVSTNLLSQERRCYDYQLTDGGEPLLAFDIDTTGNWWALTQPFSDQFRININGNESELYDYLSKPIFSPDGERFAYFCKKMNVWHIAIDDTLIPIHGQQSGVMKFTPNSKELIYSYFDGEIEKFKLADKIIETYNRIGDFAIGKNSSEFAYLGKRGDGVVVNINGKESSLFNDIQLIGFWHNGDFLFAGMNGNQWKIYKNFNPISEAYSNIHDIKINLNANVCAFVVTNANTYENAIVISDEYEEPLIGTQYERAYDLVLHPFLPIIAYVAKLPVSYVVVLGNTAFNAGSTASKPMFSHDGNDMFFLGCESNCFANINGQRFDAGGSLFPDFEYAIKPGSRTLAYSTSNTMIIKNLESKLMSAGMMTDNLVPPIYNWRSGRYETLGQINGRLYMLTCEF